VVVVGVALRTLVWWPSHNLFGVLEYDDGVYYAAARLLLDSYLPYSDFSIVHPAGRTHRRERHRHPTRPLRRRHRSTRLDRPTSRRSRHRYNDHHMALVGR
jgi:hypothetical protein